MHQTRITLAPTQTVNPPGLLPAAKIKRVFSARRSCFYPLLLLLVAIFMLASPVRADYEFLDPEDAFRFSAAASAPATLDLHYAIAPEYYMYRERFEIQAPDGVVVDTQYPPGLVVYDPTFDKDMEVYYGQVTVRVHLADATSPAAPPAGQPLTLAIISQGCADAGLCYPPESRELQIAVADGAWKVSGTGAVAGPVPAPLSVVLGGDGKPLDGSALAPAAGAATSLNPFDFGDTGLAAWLEGAGWVQVVGLCLLLGLLLAFTPCVLPMVPIMMAVIAGDAGSQGGKLSRARGLSLAAVFVLGMSIVYTVLGVFAGLLGSGLMIWLQTPWVLVTFAILLAILALAMFDVFTLQAPAAMQTALNERMNRLPGGRFSGVFVMGMLSALIVGPCVAAPLAGVLLFISQTGDVVLGGSALFALAWGSGIPLLLLGASSGVLLPKAGAWMEGVKWGFGILLFATAWWMLSSLLPDWLLVLGWVLLAMWAAVLMGAFTTLPAAAGAGRQLWKAAGVMLAAWALLMLVGLAGGGRDPFRPLAPYTGAAAGGGASMAAADIGDAVKRRFVQVGSVAELDQALAQADRPIMLDFYADWCVSCIEMERYTFSNIDVARKLDSFILLQADVTANQPEHRELLKRFRLFGPPGIIFFDTQGRELDVRVVGFQNAERFGKALDDVMTQAAASRSAGLAATAPPPSGNGVAALAGASALLSQQLRGLDGEVGQNAIAAGPFEAQQ
ncbi:MAG: protein-disulfide reductase DsbD [Alcaligenaceae bacterium]|nr:protein-disulfide reductase DsbD [Alcaligenaceae bacterium]